MTQVSDQVGPSGGDSFALGIARESERLAGKPFVVVFVERWLDPDGLKTVLRHPVNSNP